MRRRAERGSGPGTAPESPGQPEPALSPAPPTVMLLSRTGCHLCDDARAVVAEVCGPRRVSWHETDVDTDPELRSEYGDLVPVVLVDGREVAHLRVESSALLRAVEGRRPPGS